MTELDRLAAALPDTDFDPVAGRRRLTNRLAHAGSPPARRSAGASRRLRRPMALSLASVAALGLVAAGLAIGGAWDARADPLHARRWSGRRATGRRA